MSEASLPVELIALTLILALIGGLAPSKYGILQFDCGGARVNDIETESFVSDRNWTVDNVIVKNIATTMVGR